MKLAHIPLNIFDYHPMIKKLYFAIPESLIDYQMHIPARAGIIILAEKQIYANGFRKGIRISREPFVNQSCRKLSEKEIQKVLWLGVMRVWNLKKNFLKQPIERIINGN